MKRNYFTIILVFALQFTFAQIVNIPDANFKNALLTHNCADFDGDTFPDGDADTNNDGEIDATEANAVLGLDLDSDLIDSLEGIASFTNIQFITCVNNNLTQLDVSQNLNLMQLECTSNDIIELDLSTNINLTILNANFNELTTLTFGNNSNLDWVRCASNNLTTIDFSQLPNLRRLSIGYNQLTSIDVSNNLLLEELLTFNNQITFFDLSSNTNLITLLTASNALNYLDTSNNPLLERLDCTFNNLAFLDVSTNTNLVDLFCQNNLLTGLDIQNGANTNINLFNATSNPNLTCINVDDAAYSQSQSSWTKDAIASYDTNCPALSTEEFQTNTAISLFPNPTSRRLQIESKQPISNITINNLVGQQVKAFTIQLHQKSIDISTLKTGSYFVNVQSTSGNTYTKLIVKK
ncbi:T9SS type A sorting domain-containing protein [Kordia sp.]|uniref:T9SS type A sorting domain-containing protein n=1 Tax=Kordia sp. TaxID=1965332 RepID=UPI003D2BC3A8